MQIQYDPLTSQPLAQINANSPQNTWQKLQPVIEMVCKRLQRQTAINEPGFLSNPDHKCGRVKAPPGHMILSVPSFIQRAGWDVLSLLAWEEQYSSHDVLRIAMEARSLPGTYCPELQTNLLFCPMLKTTDQAFSRTIISLIVILSNCSQLSILLRLDSGFCSNCCSLATAWNQYQSRITWTYDVCVGKQLIEELLPEYLLLHSIRTSIVPLSIILEGLFVTRSSRQSCDWRSVMQSPWDL